MLQLDTDCLNAVLLKCFIVSVTVLLKFFTEIIHFFV